MSYNLLNPVHIITAQSMATSITSEPVEVKLQDDIGVQLHWTGTPTGTFQFQVSMDYLEDSMGNVINPGRWITVPVTPAITATGAGDDAYVDLVQISAPYIRVMYTSVSGVGTLDAFVNGKGI